eukprot:12811493-Heterocapsa_arctica.AAC.1
MRERKGERENERERERENNTESCSGVTRPLPGRGGRRGPSGPREGSRLKPPTTTTTTTTTTIEIEINNI